MRALAPAALSPGRYAPPHKDAARGAHLTGWCLAGWSEEFHLLSGWAPLCSSAPSDPPALPVRDSQRCQLKGIAGPSRWERRMKKTHWTSWSSALAVLLPTMRCRSAWPSTRTGDSASHRCRPSRTAWVNSRQGVGKSWRGRKSKAMPTAETPHHLSPEDSPAETSTQRNHEGKKSSTVEGWVRRCKTQG